MREVLQRLTSRKFLVSIGFLVLVVINKLANWGINDGELVLIAGVLASYIGTQGFIDFKKIDNVGNDIADTVKESTK